MVYSGLVGRVGWGVLVGRGRVGLWFILGWWVGWVGVGG